MYPDLAPEKTPCPYITYQQVGGEVVNFLDSTIPEKSRARFQVNVWGDTRAQVAALAKAVEDAMRGATSLQPFVENAPMTVYEQDTKLRGSIQEFSVWDLTPIGSPAIDPAP